jgi:protein arginine kinase
MGIHSEVDPPKINRLIMAIRPAILQRIAGRELSPDERDIERAALIREMMKS